jgi:hypothetical protein
MATSTSLLRAFRHPLLLGSILVLLLNDHVLKALIPSVLTGKLSDFAGMFFFPFMVGAGVQGAGRLGGRRVGGRLALLVGFGLSAAAFGAFKTLPGANLWMADLLSGLLGLPVKIALDPSDLLALVMFVPAWGLWGRIERDAYPAALGKRVWLVLGLGALACVATAPCPPVSSIQRVIAVDDRVYANRLFAGPDIGYPYGYVSSDRGQTWQMVEQLPQEILADMAHATAWPLTLCDPADEQSCFRIGGEQWVEGSQDGGKTWAIAWQIPTGREAFMRRIASGQCGMVPNTEPMDMTFVKGDNRFILVVAMGNEGVLLYIPAKGWQRVAVDSMIRPTPFYATSLSEAFQNVSSEWLIALASMYLLYLGLGIWGWIYAIRHRQTGGEHTSSWVFKPLWILAIWILLLALFVLFPGLLQGLFRYPNAAIGNAINVILTVVLLGLSLGMPVICLVVWGRAGKLAAKPGSYSRYGWFALGLTVGIWGIVALGMTLWALGVIDLYEVALSLVVVAAVVVLGWGVRRMRKGMREALVSGE